MSLLDKLDNTILPGLPVHEIYSLVKCFFERLDDMGHVELTRLHDSLRRSQMQRYRLTRILLTGTPMTSIHFRVSRPREAHRAYLAA